jgi:hypothetical protein
MMSARASSPVLAQSTDPSALPRLGFNDLSYVGGFRLPAEAANGDSFSIGGKALTYNPADNSLFISSRAGRVAEVSIPAPVNSSNPEAMPFATFRQGFFDPTEGRLSQVASDGVALDGLMVYGNRLYGTASIYYDANNTQRISHYSHSLRLDENSFQGWASVWDATKTGFVSGMMAVVPNEWRAQLGGPAATGQCCIPIVMRTSWGPAAFAFNPAEVGQAPVVAASPLLYYTGEHPTLGHFNDTNPTYGSTIQMGGLAIIAGTRTALYFGRNGTGPMCYGNGTNNQTLHGTKGPDGATWCYDPTSPDKGQHAYPYRYQVWAYDLNDFAAVKAGQKQPWEIVPYGVWPFDLPTPEIQVKLGGVGYDAANQRLYVSQLYADRDGYSYRPVVHVFQINAMTGSQTDPAPTPEPDPAPVPAPEGSTVISSITLAVNRNAPQVAGTAITFTAFATGGTIPYEYKWLVDNGSGLTPVTPWSAIDSFTWTPGSANPNYRVGVWARSNGNTRDEPEASASSPFAITSPVYVPVSSVTIAANKTAPQVVGTTVTWAATAQGGNGPLQYKWLVHDGGSWSAVTGWSTQNTFAWTPASVNPYRVGVWVRSNGSTRDEPDATASEDFAINSAAPLITRLTEVLLSTNRVAPQPAGQTIVATATPVGGSGHTYRWLIHDGAQWNVVTGWTQSNQFAWTPAKSDPNYRIGVWVRNGGNISENYDVSSSMLFPIQ